MQNTQPHIDGLMVRRRPQSGGVSRPRATLDGKLSLSPGQAPTGAKAPEGLVLARTAEAAQPEIGLPKPRQRQIVPVDLNLDGSGPGGVPPAEPAKPVKDGKNPRRKAGLKRFSFNRKKIVRWALIGLAVVLLCVGGYFAWKFLSTGGKIFKGNVIGALFTEGKPLKKDENGRTNVVLFGTSEDDPGHDGPDLTDSIMIASISQDKKDAFLISIPRDLWIDFGEACPAGYQARINAIYKCFKDKGEDQAQTIMRQKIGEIFGLDIQYSVHVNYTAMRDIVDALGGITVVIDSKDPRGILDRNFDWDCPNGRYTCYNVKYPNGPANLNGKQALYLARARGANGITYGLEQANFDREQYQRKILIAIKDKAVSAGTLANPVAVNNLLDALGNNVRTNFDADEVKTLVKLGQDVKTENIVSLVLNDPEAPLVTTGNVGNESIVLPVAGLFEYSEIQKVVKSYATGDKAVLEKAVIDVLNASGQPGQAQTAAAKVEDGKLEVGVVGNAPTSAGTVPVQIIDLSQGKKPATLEKLKELFSGATVAQVLPAGVSSQADFVVIIGQAAAQ